MKFVFIAKHRNIWPVAWLCNAMGVSRSGFHAWLNRSPSARSRSDETVGQQVSPDTPCAVGSVAGKEACLHLQAYCFVASGSGAGRSVQPGMEARPGHAHRIAERWQGLILRTLGYG